MENIGCGHAQEDEQAREEVHPDAALPEGIEESGTDLQADGEDEEDKAEILHEGEDGRVGAEAEMAQQDPQKDDPRGPDGDAADLEASEVQAGRDDDGKKEDGMGDARPEKQFLQHNLSAIVARCGHKNTKKLAQSAFWLFHLSRLRCKFVPKFDYLC